MEKLKNKTPLVRFPEFKEDWISEQLGKHIKKTDKKNKKNLNLPVYSINNKEGFLPQSEQFDGVNSNDRGFDISIYKIIQPNTFAYNPARINVGSIGYSNNLANILISSLYVCFQTDDKIDDSFLLAFLDTNGFKTSVLRFQEGGVRQYLFFDNISKIKLPFPTLPEQKKIAHFFSIIDQKLTQLQEKKTALELYKKGIMQQLFCPHYDSDDLDDEQDFAKDSQEKNQGNQENQKKSKFRLRFKDDNGQDFPDWEVKKLGEVGDKISSGKSKSVLDGKYQLFGSTGLIGYCDTATHNGEYLLIARVGANAGLINKISGEFGVSDNTLVVDVYENINYILNYLMNYNLNKLVFGSGQPLITGGQLKSLDISLPSKQEQTKIANFLSKIDNKINTVTEKIEQTKEYKKGLLQQMFCN